LWAILQAENSASHLPLRNLVISDLKIALLSAGLLAKATYWKAL
jgi:hypothetical protein